MKKLSLLLIVLLIACSRNSETTYSLNCEGTQIEISNEGGVSKTSKQNREYQIDSNQMAQRSCIKEGTQLTCYKETELPDLQRSKEQFAYNTGDYSLSEVKVLIGIDKNSGKPIFIQNELFRATCPMTVRRKS
jgi:uncharacterized lipoprotein YehR (DUF1307 family)